MSMYSKYVLSKQIGYGIGTISDISKIWNPNYVWKIKFFKSYCPTSAASIIYAEENECDLREH